MFVIGIDVGTTGTKAIVVDEKGNILGKGYKEYSLITLPGGKIEQNADDWYDAAVFATKAALDTFDGDKNEIVALSLSTQGGSTVPVDENFRPLSNAYTWMDRRATREISEAVSEAGGGDVIYKKTGWEPDPSLDIAKFRWMRKHEEELFNKAHMFLTTIEYMNYKLTGKAVTDPGNAAMRQLFDIVSGEWDSFLLNLAGVEKDRLPEYRFTGEYIGTLTKDAAEDFSLPETVKVYNGGHDQYCAAVGCGAISDGDMLLSTGTTWVVLGVTSKPIFTESFLAPGVHPCKGVYGNIASLQSAGSALKWLTQTIGEDDFSKLDAEAEKRRDSAKNIYFYPYLAGAGFPHNIRAFNSCVLGMELMNDKYDLARALMEGVAFETRMVLEEFEKFGTKITSLKMVGGAAKSEVWSRITCDICGCEISFPAEADTCCVGAAILAAVGCGIYPDYKTAGDNMIKYRGRLIPDKGVETFYNDKYDKYRQGHFLLRAFFEK